VFISDLEVERDIEEASRCDVNVLITGGNIPTRRAVAHRIHQMGGRSAGGLVIVNDVEEWNVNHQLASASLGATMFVEEIGKLDEKHQTALLHILDRRAALSAQFPAWRIIAASDARLYDLMVRGEFQSELFYRLNVIHIVIPQ